MQHWPFLLQESRSTLHLTQNLIPVGFIPIVDTKINKKPHHLFEKEHVFNLLLPDKQSEVFLSANSKLELDRWAESFERLQV